MKPRTTLLLLLLTAGVSAFPGHVQAAPNTAGAAAGRPVEAANVGIVCDGVTDTTAAINSDRLSGRTIHLPDHKTCIAKVSGVDNTRWICQGCTIAHGPNDTTEGHTYIAYKSNIEFDGVAFDMNGVSVGSFVGGPRAATELLTVSGGGGFEPNFRFAFKTDKTGGCRSEVSGYITTDSKGVPDKAVITSPGAGCTSLPTPRLSSSKWGGDGYDHIVPPAFAWAKNAAPQRSAGGLTLFYVGNSKNIVFRNCRWLSTGATLANLKANFNGMLVWKSSTSFINPTFENSIGGLQLKIDSGGDNVRSYVENIRADGAQIDAVQLMGDPSNTEINGGLITNVGEMIAGSGEAGNGINLYLTSHNKIHNVTILNPRFSGIRVTGGANASHRTSAYNDISDITIKGNGEVAVWAELGAEFNSFKNISISDCDSGVYGANMGDRPHGGANTFSHLMISGCKRFGAGLEHDEITDSTITDTPIAFRVGFGGTGKDNVIKGNTCENTGHGYSLMAICFGLDRYAKNPSLLNDNAIKGTGIVGLASLEFSNRLIIQNISNSNPAIVQYNPSVNARSAAPAVGTTYVLFSIFGMLNSVGQSVNGHFCTASAVNTTGNGPNPYSITCGGSRSMPALDTTAYNVKPYEHPPQGQSNPELLEIYKDGTKTPFWQMPAPIDTRSAFRKAQ